MNDRSSRTLTSPSISRPAAPRLAAAVRDMRCACCRPGVTTCLHGAVREVDMYAMAMERRQLRPRRHDSDRRPWPAWPGLYNRRGLRPRQDRQFVDGKLNAAALLRSDIHAAAPTCVCRLPEAAIVAAHGWNDGNRWGALMRNSWNGLCGATMGGAGGRMFVGDGTLKFLHASSCLSPTTAISNGMRSAMRKAAAPRAARADRFHGLMWISSSFNNKYRDTASDGLRVGRTSVWSPPLQVETRWVRQL